MRLNPRISRHVAMPVGLCLWAAATLYSVRHNTGTLAGFHVLAEDALDSLVTPMAEASRPPINRLLESLGLPPTPFIHHPAPCTCPEHVISPRLLIPDACGLGLILCILTFLYIDDLYSMWKFRSSGIRYLDD